MKWRLAPQLDLEHIRDTRVLIFGAGTLGCNIARSLLVRTATVIILTIKHTLHCRHGACGTLTLLMPDASRSPILLDSPSSILKTPSTTKGRLQPPPKRFERSLH